MLTLQEILGHKNIETTPRRYAHIIAETSRAAVSAITAFVPNAVPRPEEQAGDQEERLSVISVKGWRPGPESNRHGRYRPRNFKSEQVQNATWK
jgi:hypothetical protein